MFPFQGHTPGSAATTTTTIFICTLALCEVHCKNIRNEIRILAAWNNHRDQRNQAAS